MSDARARVVASRKGLGTGLEGIIIRIREMMDKVHLDFAILIRNGPRATREERISLSVAKSTLASVGGPAASSTGSLPTGEVASARASPIWISMLFRRSPFRLPLKLAMQVPLRSIG